MILHIRRRVGVAAVAAIWVLVLAGCGGDSGKATLAAGTATIFGRTVELTAHDDAGEVTGTARVTARTEPSFTIDFSCIEHTKSVTILAGGISESEDDERPVGTRAAVLLADRDPVGFGMWFDDAPSSKTCDEFIDSIPDQAITDPATFVPADDITLE